MGRLPNLLHLNMSFNYLPDSSMANILTNLEAVPQLISLDISGNELMRRSAPGQQKGAKFSTLKAHISASFHSFQLIFGRVIISPRVLVRLMLFLTELIAKHSS